jgi:hypothetical protein
LENINLIKYHLLKQNSLANSLIFKVSLLLVSLLCSFFSDAQTFEDLDSLLLDKDIENYSIRVFTNYRVNRFSIENSGSIVKFTPNNRHGLGFGFANKKVIVDIAFNLKNPNKEATRRFDLQGTTILKNRHFISAYLQSYKGFQGRYNFDEPSSFRSDLRSVSFGFNYLFSLDNIEFSYALLKAGLAEDKHKDVFITGGFGAFGIFDYFSSDATILSETAGVYFNEEANIKRYQGAGLGILAGVISYFKLPKDITATVGLMPGIGLMSKKITLQDGSFKPSQPMLYKLDFSVGIVYNFNQFYTSLTYSNGLYTTSFGNDNKYRLNISKAKLAIGYKFGRKNKAKLNQSLF